MQSVPGTTTFKLVQTLTKPNGSVSSITLLRSGAGIPAASTNGCLFTAFDQNGTQLSPACSSATPLSSIARVDLAFTATPSDGSKVSGTTQTFQTSTQITGLFTPGNSTSTAATP
jgi:hypothetical protein